MPERFTLQDAGYITYSDMLDRLHQGFPTVPLWRLEQIIAAENDAITGGVMQIVPAEVEVGATEMLERELRNAHDDSEVA
jgi:hypothetical protein